MKVEHNTIRKAMKHRLRQEVYILSPTETAREVEINCQNNLASQ